MSGIWDPLRVELDNDPPREEPPELGYVVCATARSGSGLLCRALADAGAGLPAEYVNPNQRLPLAARWGATDAASYVRALVGRRTTANGIFGLKLHWEHAAELGPDELPRFFPRFRWIHIRREDVDAQAVSHWQALHSDVWSVRADREPVRGGRVPYDYAGIARLRARIEHDEDEWRSFFARHALEPIEVVFEQLVAGYEPAVRRTLDALRAGFAPAVTVLPDSVPVRDDRTAELLERFRSDLGRRGEPSGRSARELALAVRLRFRLLHRSARL